MKSITYLYKSTVLAFIAILSFSNAQANEMSSSSAYGKQKVVYHVNYDDPKRQASALRNIQNHINAVGSDNLDLKVVMHGNGLSLVVKPEALAHLPKMKQGNANNEMQQKIDRLKLQGVGFHVCANTLKGKNVDYQKDLYDIDEQHIVKSGVAELAHLQQQGFTYIRP